MQLESRFLEGFLKSWGVILASEIGDKTFFIAAVMAMRNSRRQVHGALLWGWTGWRAGRLQRARVGCQPGGGGSVVQRGANMDPSKIQTRRSSSAR